MRRQIFKIREFQRWMRKTDLTDALLIQAITEIQQGLIDADLGSNLVKKRIALPGRGKSGSTRTLIATNKKDRWFFIFGFLFLVLRKMIALISMRENWTL